MFQIINWLCLICISFLVLDVMIYFCKDAIKICNTLEVKKAVNIEKTKPKSYDYLYENKVAK